MNAMNRDIQYVEKVANPEILVLIKNIYKGLPYELSPRLMRLLEIDTGDMLRQLAISQRTLYERKKAKRFKKRESERLLRLARLYLKAIKVLADPKFAVEWMKKSKPDLYGYTPLELAQSEIGAREVENLLGRIAHGDFG